MSSLGTLDGPPRGWIALCAFPEAALGPWLGEPGRYDLEAVFAVRIRLRKSIAGSKMANRQPWGRIRLEAAGRACNPAGWLGISREGWR